MKKNLIVFGMIAAFALPTTTHAATCASITTLGGSTSYHVGDQSSSPGRLRAELFTPATDCTVSDIQINAKYDPSTPPGNFGVALYTVSGGVPGTQIEAGTAITGFTGSFSWQTSTFSGATTLTGGTTYAIVGSMTSGWNDTQWYDWNATSAGGSGGANICGKNPGGSWSCGGATDDLVYIVEGSVPSPPSPSDGATSTIEQTETNLAYGFAIWMFGFALAVWITQDKRARV